MSTLRWGNAQLNQLVKTYESDPVAFLAFSFNEKSTIERFLAKNSFSYAQLPDARALIKEMSINIYPTHIIVDKSGKIQEIVILLPVVGVVTDHPLIS